MYTFIPYTNCPAFSQWLPCNAASQSGTARWCKRLCSGPVDAQRLPRLRRLLRKLSAIGCRVLDRIVHIYTLHKLPGGPQRLSNLRRFLQKCTSVNGRPIKWLVSFARPPAFSQWLPCNAASHSGPEVWCKRLCSSPMDHRAFRACNLLFPFGNPHTFYLSLTSQVHKVSKQQNPRSGFPERGFCSLRKGSPLRSIY